MLRLSLVKSEQVAVDCKVPINRLATRSVATRSVPGQGDTRPDVTLCLDGTWDHHYAVVEDDRVCDGTTGEDGLPFDQNSRANAEKAHPISVILIMDLWNCSEGLMQRQVCIYRTRVTRPWLLLSRAAMRAPTGSC